MNQSECWDSKSSGVLKIQSLPKGPTTEIGLSVFWIFVCHEVSGSLGSGSAGSPATQARFASSGTRPSEHFSQFPSGLKIYVVMSQFPETH